VLLIVINVYETCSVYNCVKGNVCTMSNDSETSA
jgi:hypothetical protein